MQTIGQKLKAARQAKQLTLDEVFEATRIRAAYLQALESDDLASLPSPVQARGYLRNYAEYLELDFDELLEDLRASQQTSGEIIGPADLTVEQPVQTLKPAPVQEAAPLPGLKADPVQETESQPAPVKPKRRGRKKAEPEAEPIQVLEPQPEAVEEPVVQPEPVPDETVAPAPVPVSQPDVSETLWQTWLNRISSVIPARANRKTEPRETPAIDRVDETRNSSQTPDGSPPETSQPSDPKPSTEIFKEIGAQLRERRENLSLHLEEVERNTHVKAHYLEALEQGDMSRLPSTVQTRGMLSNYASFLDMDVDAVLLRFADALQARHREKNPQKPARKPGAPIVPEIPPVRGFIAGDMIFGIGMAVLLIGFAIWGINRVLTLQSLRDVQPTAPSISEVLLTAPNSSLFTATATFLPAESLSGEATATILVPTLNANVNVQMNLVAVERTYMRVTVDGKVTFEGRVVPGNAYPYEAEDQIEVLVGNGAAVRVQYNGRDLGLMGSFGQVVSNIYMADEIITPTALPSPTATNTVSPTPTLRPTSTPVPSRTPIPSRTPAP